MSYLILDIGMTGQGKSDFVKSLIRSKPNARYFVFDVNNEYGEEAAKGEPFNFSTDLEEHQCRVVELNAEAFIDECKLRRNCTCILEDATGFLRGNLGKKVIQVLQAKRHNQNTYILLFHSIRSVPVQLFDFANFVVLHKTNDTRAEVERKYPVLLSTFDKVAKLPPSKYPKISRVIKKLM